MEELNSIHGLIACLCFISSVLQQQVAIQRGPPLFIEEVAQAKRCDGGVLKVEQPGGPLAVDELNSIPGLIACLCFISSVLQQ